MRRLLANRWQTPDGVILHSKFTHDYQFHKDKEGRYFLVDGGNDYIRTSNSELMKNLCVYDDGTFKTQREWVMWGKNYDKTMNLLPKTEWIPIKNLETDHIYAILSNVKNIDPFYRRLLEDEIVFRCGEKVE